MHSGSHQLDLSHFIKIVKILLLYMQKDKMVVNWTSYRNRMVINELVVVANQPKMERDSTSLSSTSYSLTFNSFVECY